MLAQARFDAHRGQRGGQPTDLDGFHDHLVLEYEIAKLGLRLRAAHGRRAGTQDEPLDTHFGTLRSKDWFDRQTLAGLARLRGMECRAPEHFAGAFTLRKAKIL